MDRLLFVDIVNKQINNIKEIALNKDKLVSLGIKTYAVYFLPHETDILHHNRI